MSNSGSLSESPRQSPSQLVSRLCALGAAALFSTGGAAIKGTIFNSWQVAGMRSVLAAAVLLLVFPQARRLWNWRVLLVGLSYSATMLLFVAANKLTTAANTIFLQYTAPLYLLLAGPFLLREPVRRRDVTFMVMVGGGLLLFFAGRQDAVATAPHPITGNILAAVSGLTWAGTIAGLRWLSGKTHQGDPSMATVAMGNLLAAAIALPLAFPLPAAIRPVDWAVVSYLGLFQIGLAYVFLVTAVRRLPALEASLLMLIEPALNPVWAWMIHGERPGAWAIAGGSLILGVTVGKTILDLRSVPGSAAKRATRQ